MDYPDYNNFEEALQLSWLEEYQTLHLAMRHIVRTGHEKGMSIAFPTPEALDRIQLRSVNLPTEVKALLDQVQKVFNRRSEVLDMEELYKHFVKANGRIAFDSKEVCPSVMSLRITPDGRRE